MRRVLVTMACAAVLGWGSLAVRAQGDGGYRLVANWPTLPAGMFFGPADPKDKPTPPNDRIAEAAARRASGGARAGGGGANANANGGAAPRGGGGANAAGGGGGGRGGGTPVPLINQDITLPESPGGAAGQAQPGISGLAIDKNDLIYVFNRGVKPVMVFDPSGKLVRAGADQEIPVPCRCGQSWTSGPPPRSGTPGRYGRASTRVTSRRAFTTWRTTSRVSSRCGEQVT